MKRILSAAFALVALAAGDAHAGDAHEVNVAVRWNDTLLQAVEETHMPPPQVARALAIVHTCIYDAWAAYDSRAVGTRLGGSLRRPAAEHTQDNKAEAISHAAYRALVDLFPSKQASLFDPAMAQLGYGTGSASIGWSTPASVGSTAAAAVIAFRHQDGANQIGTLTPGGAPYADYTGYVPANDSFTLSDPDRWQPLQQSDGAAQKFLVPHWGRVIPFALTSASQFRPKKPARHGTPAYWVQAAELVAISGALGDRGKAIATYWADGPETVTPPGHWMLFAQAISARDRHGLDEDVKMFFALGNALLDASIAAWDSKLAFDYIRPASAIRFLFAGRQIRAWAGPYQGTALIDGSQWRPYIATPPFAEYVSGHSTFSAAAAAVLRRFTGSDRMDLHAIVTAGSSPVEPGFAPAADVILKWHTFSEAADQAGISRRYGGIHFRDGDRAAREMGRIIGSQAWKKAAGYFAGARRTK